MSASAHARHVFGSIDRLIDEPVVSRSDPFERGQQLLVGAARAAQRDCVEDRVHRAAQVAVAAEQLIELLLVDRRELIRGDGGCGLETLEADLVADAVERHLAGRDALEQDHRELTAQRCELIALAGSLSRTDHRAGLAGHLALPPPRNRAGCRDVPRKGFLLRRGSPKASEVVEH